MTGFYTKFITTEGNRDTLIALLMRAAASMSNNADCRLYIVNKDTEDACATWVTELWTNEEAHLASLKQDAAKHLIAGAMPLLTTRPLQTKLEATGGKGI